MKPDSDYPTIFALLDELERSPLARLTLQEIIMQIQIILYAPRQIGDVVMPALAGQPVEVDLGPGVVVEELGQPERGTLTVIGSVMRYEPPATIEQDTVTLPPVHGKAGRKVPPPTVKAA